ncbi:energy transducer TonB [Flavobacterium faecale]|uniref:energy transducer TonB n=1 Tax=Flavobacterium faecale TaxID=1355330 RepID=UPI003AAC8D1A
MSKSSIYETNWINLVFENRNKNYGAYQLRQETTKTSLLALLVSLSFCAVLIIIPKVLQSFHLIETNTIEEVTPIINDKITPVDITPFIKKAKTEPILKSTETKPQIITEKVETPTLKNPTIVQANQATQEIPKNNTISPITVDPNAIIGSSPTVYSGNSTVSGTGNGNGTDTDIHDSNTIVNITNLDKQPTFPGGIEKFYSFVGRNFETPEINDEKSIRIMVYFVVEKDGSMTDIQVKNNPGYGLAQEAIRVLKSLKTKWSPGIIESKPVRTAYTLPITIQMN